MIEFEVWLVSLVLVGAAHLALFLRYMVNPQELAIPAYNAEFMRRLALTYTITYFSFAIFGVFAIFAFPAELAVGLGLIDSWWIVEIFIFWNIRTAFLVFMNLKRLRVKI